MAWRDLLFAHWPADPAEIRRAMPAGFGRPGGVRGLELDTRDGCAWVGVVPFRMADTAPRLFPALPGRPSNFLELNVRTYVRWQGRPGVWFFSLDADSRLAVRGARASFGLPYHDARMRFEHETSGWIRFTSERTHRGVGAGTLDIHYRGAERLPRAEPGSIEHWLTERYFLAVLDRRGRPRLGEIHHEAWPLRIGEARIENCTVTDAFGIQLPDAPPTHLHVVESLDVLGWALGRPLPEPGTAGRAIEESPRRHHS